MCQLIMIKRNEERERERKGQGKQGKREETSDRCIKNENKTLRQEFNRAIRNSNPTLENKVKTINSVFLITEHGKSAVFDLRFSHSVQRLLVLRKTKM